MVSLQHLVKSCEHGLYLQNFLGQSSVSGAVYETYVSAEQQVVLELRSRAQADSNKPAEFRVSMSPTAFSKIGCN